MFARGGLVSKTYVARSSSVSSVALPLTVRSRIVKHAVCYRLSRSRASRMPRRGRGVGRRLVSADSAHGGRTHQLRVHMASLGLPIDNDPLYPRVVEVAADDFSAPLRLVAQRLEFDDPLSGEPRSFVSAARAFGP